VNYLLRLKKQIERKIIIETLQNLNPLVGIKDYRYFGFGSVYFADFILFHKYLNIKKMISIDNKFEDEKRFRYNKPFKFIDFEVIECTKYLQNNLNWDDKLLLWLDYDVPLSRDILSDVEYLASRVKSKDFFLITVEAECPLKPKDFLNMFDEYIPISYKSKTKIKKDFPIVLNKTLFTALYNGLGNQISKLDFLQIFNFVYKDTKEMYTCGGIFGDKTVFDEVKEKLNEPDYLSHDERIINISCPILTPKEKTHLDSFIEKNGDIDCRFKPVKDVGLSTEEIQKYCIFYKHYPQFFESVY